MQRPVTILVLALILAMALSGTSQGGVLAYKCEVLHEMDLAIYGTLKDSSRPLYKGGIFHIERVTGTVMGGGLGNSAYPTKIIVDPGNSEMSYKLLARSHEMCGPQGSQNAVYIQVQEFEEGRIKPFVVVINSHVLTGTCE